jgi:hypothetical protein
LAAASNYPTQKYLRMGQEAQARLLRFGAAEVQDLIRFARGRRRCPGRPEFHAEILRHDLESALERSRDPAGIACLNGLIETIERIPPDIFDIYIELFEELPDTELHQEMLTEVRDGSWLPKTATDFVQGFISRTTGTNKSSVVLTSIQLSNRHRLSERARNVPHRTARQFQSSTIRKKVSVKACCASTTPSYWSGSLRSRAFANGQTEIEIVPQK